MMKESFANRLQQAMNLRNLKSSQIEKISEQLYKEGKINKIIKMPLITDYLKGRYEAKQSNIYALSLILNVDEAWLMGAYVPMERTPDKSRTDNDYLEFIAEDDAMFPLLDIGDKAYICQQTDIEDGATYLIILDNKKTIRKIILSEDKSCYRLVAMNACYKYVDININEINKIKVLGKVTRIENQSAFK